MSFQDQSGVHCALRESAHAFTEYRNGRKRDSLFPLPRVSPPPQRKTVTSQSPRTRNPAESEARLPTCFGSVGLFRRCDPPPSGGLDPDDSSVSQLDGPTETIARLADVVEGLPPSKSRGLWGFSLPLFGDFDHCTGLSTHAILYSPCSEPSALFTPFCWLLSYHILHPLKIWTRPQSPPL